MNTKQGLALLVWIIIVAVLLGGGYVGYRKYQRPTTDNQPTNVEATKVDIGDWQTYRNDDYGFEFRYPPTWYYSGGSRGDTQYLICLNPTGTSGDCTGLLSVNWDISLQERYSSMKSMLMKDYLVTESEILVDGVKGRLLTIDSPKGYGKSVFWEKEYLFNFKMSSRNEILFDQILSTFKFTK